jgi:hypothetical protein
MNLAHSPKGLVSDCGTVEDGAAVSFRSQRAFYNRFIAYASLAEAEAVR